MLSSQTIYKLNLLDIANENIQIPPATFETAINFIRFSKIIHIYSL